MVTPKPMQTLPTAIPPKRRRPRNLCWQSLIGPFEAVDFQAIPLTSSEDLREEGELMNHCVGRRYPRWCQLGAVRVFSIRDLDGRRAATASLYFDFDENRWQIEQCKGYENLNVTEETRDSADNSSTSVPTDLAFLVEYLRVMYQAAQNEADQQIANGPE